MEQRRLQADDWAEVAALLSEVIDQAEPGQPWVSIELADHEDDANAVTGGEEST